MSPKERSPNSITPHSPCDVPTDTNTSVNNEEREAEPPLRHRVADVIREGLIDDELTFQPSVTAISDVVLAFAQTSQWCQGDPPP